MRITKAVRQGVWLLSVVVMILGWNADASAQVKMSVFNYGTLNLEAAGYGTTVTNLLLTTLGGEPQVNLVERKELEAFLSLNDLQQDDRLENVVNVGTRLGINIIVVGTVEKKGGVITINSKVIQVEENKVIFNNQLRVLGDAGLVSEVQQLGKKIAAVITTQAAARESGAANPALAGGPVNVRLTGGNKCLHLFWDDSSAVPSAGYEIVRAEQEGGPFVRIGQSGTREYHDKNLEFDKAYYYKVRSISGKGVWSAYSAVASGKTVLTPGVPVILKTEGHVKSILLTWAPNPVPSGDPLKISSYRLDRARIEDWPREVVINLTGKELGVGSNSELDKLLKVTYLDKGLADGVDYYYKITALNEKNLESEHCLTVKGTTLPGVARITAQGDLIREVRLTWPAVDSPFIKGYNIYRSATEPPSFTKIKRLDSFQVDSHKMIQYSDTDGLADDAHYSYQVTAFEEGGAETDRGVTATATTKKRPPVAQGINVTSGLARRVEMTWLASNSEDVQGYNIYCAKEPGSGGKPALMARIVGRSTSSYTATRCEEVGLDDNATYRYLMTTFNTLNVESEPSETLAATTKARPAKPTGLKGEDAKVKSTFLTWQANPEKDIALFNILRAPATEESTYTNVGQVRGKTEFADLELQDGVAYLYRVQAEDADGLQSELSDPIRVRTKQRPLPPENVTGEFRQGKAELRWNKGAEGDLDHYNVYEEGFLTSGRKKVASVREAKYSETTNSKDKKKSYVVTAVDRDGLESEVSTEITVTAK